MTRGALVALLLLAVLGFARWRSTREFAPTRIPEDAFPAGERAPLTLFSFTSRLCAECERTPDVVRAADPALPFVALQVRERPDLLRALGVTETPTLLLADAQGRVVYARVGNPEPDELRRAVNDERAGSAKA